MRRRAGFSTAEALAGIVVTLVLIGAIYSAQRAQTKAMAAQNVYSDTQNATRTVLDTMARELRMAAFDPTQTALAPAPGPSCPQNRQGIVQATQTRIRFRQDLNGDGAINGTGEDITYDLVGDTVTRTDGAAVAQTLAGGIPVNGFAFRYFDGSNPPVELVPAGTPPSLTSGQRDCLAKVRIAIEANFPNPDPHVRRPVKSVAESEIAIRNRSLANF
jgi:hypothetical protein